MFSYSCNTAKRIDLKQENVGNKYLGSSQVSTALTLSDNCGPRLRSPKVAAGDREAAACVSLAYVLCVRHRVAAFKKSVGATQTLTPFICSRGCVTDAPRGAIWGSLSPSRKSNSDCPKRDWQPAADGLHPIFLSHEPLLSCL